MYSKWFKIYSLLCNFYFKSGGMVVRLIYITENTATYVLCRNDKMVTTRLDDFVKYFNLVAYPIKKEKDCGKL